MNDSIDPECCSMSYITVDQIARAALKLESGTLIAKIDTKSAYLIPVHPYGRGWITSTWMGAAFWFELSSKNFQLCGRCTGVVFLGN